MPTKPPELIPMAPAVAETEEPPKKRGRGRLTRLTPEVQKTICDMVAKGSHLTTAAKAAGISVDALQDWRKRGAAGRQPYAGFAQAIDQAESQCQTRMVAIIHDSAPEDFRAAVALLKMRWPELYSERRLESGPDMAALFQINIMVNDAPEQVIDAQKPEARALPPRPRPKDPNPELD